MTDHRHGAPFSFRTGMVALVVAASSLASISCGGSSPGPAPALDSFAVAVADVSGESTVRQAESTPWKAAATGEILGVAGAVKTGADGAVGLDLPGGGLSRILASSEVAVLEIARAAAESPSSLGLEVLRGAGLFRWEPGSGELTVRTPHVNAAVLGTEFALQVSGAGTRLIVATGVVRVERGGREQTVRGGYECVTPPQGPPALPTGVRLIGGAEGLAGELERFVDAAGKSRQRRSIERE
ncbi:MAG: FecR domain-containing protein [Candidatus Wallbacteria bacterium]|nr:FecR domain-containing protein [Candidatus Wallbacteria bacterium]